MSDTAAETQTLADNAYHSITREILVRMITGDTSVPSNSAGAHDFDDYALIYARAAREAQPRWDKARELADRADKLVTPDSRDLYIAHVKTQVAIHQYSNRMLSAVASLAAEKSQGRQLERIDAAIADTQSVLRALDAAEFGKWSGFYRNELFVNVRHTLALAEAYRAKLQGKPVPANVPLAVRPEDPYVRLKAYQKDRRVALQ